MTPDQIAAKLRRLKDKKSKLNKELDDVKKELTEFEMFVRDELDEMAVLSVKTKHGTYGIKEEEVPTIEDRALFMDYARQKRNMDLLQSRISSAAWRARREEGKDVPGVKAFTRRTVFLHK